MKKLSRNLLARRTRKEYLFVCASILLVLGAIIGSFSSTSSLQFLLFGGISLNHDVIKELNRHIHIQDHLFSSKTHEVKEAKVGHKFSSDTKKHDVLHPSKKPLQVYIDEGKPLQVNLDERRKAIKANFDGESAQYNIDDGIIRTINQDANYKGPYANDKGSSSKGELLRIKLQDGESSEENSAQIGIIKKESNDREMKGTKYRQMKGSIDGQMKGQRCTKSKALLKVFMYDLPPELHFGMIEPTIVKQGNTWPTNFTNMVGYPGGLTLQHSPEYWLTLDLLNNLEEEEEEEEEEEGGHNTIDSIYSKVREGHAHSTKFESQGHDDIYKTFHPKVDEKDHYNHSLYPKVLDKGHVKELSNLEIKKSHNMFHPKVEKGHIKEFSNPKVEESNNMHYYYYYPKVGREKYTIGSSYSKEEGIRRPCGAIRVKDARDADVYFVPFFSSLSYNKYNRLGMREKDIELQKKVVNYVVKQEAWRRSKGRDHVIVMHHPNSLHMARSLLEGATFVVADFGRFSSKIAHLGKDIVAPYKHIIPSFCEDASSFHSRPTLLFFQGAILRKEGGVIRKKLYSLIKSEKGVVFKNGIRGNGGIKSATMGMRSSKFCLHLAGDTPSSNRLFDAIASHCVPVIISKDIELPYEDTLDYSEFCIFVDSSQALKKGFLINLLRRIERDEWTKMWERLKEVQVHFEYQFPSQVDDAVQMLWKSIAHKVPTIKQASHKYKRYTMSNIFKRISMYRKTISTQ